MPGSNDWKFIYGIIQPSVVSLGGKHLRYYARSTSRIGRVVAADSFDGGLTWSEPHRFDVVSANSGIDAVALKGRSRRHYLQQHDQRPFAAESRRKSGW